MMLVTGHVDTQIHQVAKKGTESTISDHIILGNTNMAAELIRSKFYNLENERTWKSQSC